MFRVWIVSLTAVSIFSFATVNYGDKFAKTTSDMELVSQLAKASQKPTRNQGNSVDMVSSGETGETLPAALSGDSTREEQDEEEKEKESIFHLQTLEEAQAEYIRQHLDDWEDPTPQTKKKVSHRVRISIWHGSYHSVALLTSSSHFSHSSRRLPLLTIFSDSAKL